MLSKIILASLLFIYSVEATEISPLFQTSKIMPSNFEKATNDLRLTENQQEALLRIFYIAGYLSPKQLWSDINRANIGVLDLNIFFAEVLAVLHHAKADQDDYYKVDFKYLKHHLFGQYNDHALPQLKIDNLILYIIQHAFGRKIGDERADIKTSDILARYSEEYKKAAQEIGMIDPVLPRAVSYDIGVIAGTSRQNIVDVRLPDYQTHLSLVTNGYTIISAGKRQLWAEIDGVGEQPQKTQDGMDYILSLAERNDVALKTPPFIKYFSTTDTTKADLSKDPRVQYEVVEKCPKGFTFGKTYPNYANSEQYLTETLMITDIVGSTLGDRLHIIDTEAYSSQQSGSSSHLPLYIQIYKEQGLRPTTMPTLEDLALHLIQYMKDHQTSKVVVLYQTNQPYVKRQELEAKQAIFAALEKAKTVDFSMASFEIDLEAVGPGNISPIELVHSELAALIAVEWGLRHVDDPDIDHLLYQSRNQLEASNSLPVLPPYPHDIERTVLPASKK